MSEEVLATVRASAPRRWIGVGMLAILGAMLVYLSLATPPQTIFWQVFLLVMGVGSLVLADATRRATERAIELTAQGLRDTSGELLAAIDDIARVNRGTFAMKPSNGFVVILQSSGTRSWHPGLWWRLGKRVGIGGVTPAAQTKFMAQTLEALMAERG
jgi:hypothetical protein